MFRQIVSMAIACVLILSVLSGCAAFDRRTEHGVVENEITEGEPTFLESMDDLVTGHFYVFHDGKYYDPVWQEMSFSPDSTGYQSSHTAWFSEENFGTIPTLYKGDYLVYYQDASFAESFIFDRFSDLGYTIGLCNLEKMSSGRYSFDAVTGSLNIAPYSDAARLTLLQEEDVVIDSIGKAELRSGNVTEAGTILGLKENEYYTTEVYVGTELHAYTLKADRMAFTAMESVRINDYTFLKNRIIRINIPNYFHSGYYSVNGSGIFRYVKGNSYDSHTDFNISNDIGISAGDSQANEVEAQEFTEEQDKEKSYPFTVRRESDVTVFVRYGESERADFTYASPVVKVIGTDSVYTLRESGERSFTETIHLPAGRYYLTISEMNGRPYEYSVTAKGEK